MAIKKLTDAKKRGKKSEIDDQSLWGVRDHFVGLLENTWEHVAENFAKIKEPDDVSDALQFWLEQNRHNSQYATRILLRPTSRPATETQLYRKRKYLRSLRVRYVESNWIVQNLWDPLQAAMRINAANYSDREQEVITDKIRECAQTLARAGREYSALREEEAELTRDLEDSEAYFARSEFADFCESDRYEKTPLNTANALAGLPYMGWRRSIDRCRAEPPTSTNGLSFQVFQAILRIVESCTRPLDLEKHAKSWLESRPKVKTLGESELRERWYYLRWAIRTVLKTNTKRRSLPYAIAREFWKRKSRPSEFDVSFADGEKIVG